MNFDFSHLAIVKHLGPDNYISRLLDHPELVQNSEQVHFRPFNGHHCQVPVTHKGSLTPEVKSYLVFVEALMALWKKSAANKHKTMFACPEIGPLLARRRPATTSPACPPHGPTPPSSAANSKGRGTAPSQGAVSDPSYRVMARAVHRFFAPLALVAAAFGSALAAPSERTQPTRPAGRAIFTRSPISAAIRSSSRPPPRSTTLSSSVMAATALSTTVSARSGSKAPSALPSSSTPSFAASPRGSIGPPRSQRLRPRSLERRHLGPHHLSLQVESAPKGPVFNVWSQRDADRAIRAAYRNVLDRDPDEAGLPVLPRPPARRRLVRVAAPRRPASQRGVRVPPISAPSSAAFTAKSSAATPIPPVLRSTPATSVAARPRPNSAPNFRRERRRRRPIRHRRHHPRLPRYLERDPDPAGLGNYRRLVRDEARTKTASATTSAAARNTAP